MTFSADTYHIMKTEECLASLYDMELNSGIGSNFFEIIQNCYHTTIKQFSRSMQLC